MRRDADAAEDDRGGNFEELAVGAEALLDLRGELAGRSEDQRARALRRGGRGMRGQTLQDGQSERGGFAGAGLRDADEIAGSAAGTGSTWPGWARERCSSFR